MPTETPAAPAAPAPAPVTVPDQPKSPAPPLPKAQEASLPSAVKKSPVQPPQKPPAPKSMEQGLRELGASLLDGPTEAASEPAKAPETPEKAPDTPKAEKPAPVAEKSPYAGMELPENATAKEQANFRKMKETYEAEWQKAQNDRVAVDTLKKELETYKKATPADTQEAQRLRDELKQVQDRLAVHELSQHPDFQKQYTQPKQKALALADELAKDYQVPNAGELKNLLELPRPEFAKRLDEMAKDMPGFDKNKFFNSMDEARRLQTDEKGALSQATQLRANLQAKAAQEARNAFEASKQDFTSKVPELTIPEGADDEMVQDIRSFNQARAEALQEAEQATFGQMNERQVADAMVLAANYKVLAKHLIPNLTKQRAKLEKLVADQHAELTAIKGKKNPGSFTGAAPAEAPRPRSLEELAKQMLPQ